MNIIQVGFTVGKPDGFVILRYSGVDKSKTAGHELKSLMVIFAVIFLVNTPTSYLESALYPYIFDKIDVWASVFNREADVINDYSSLAQNEVIKQEFSQRAELTHANSLIDILLNTRKEGYIDAIQLLPIHDFRKSSQYLSNKVEMFFYNKTNLKHPYVHWLEADLFVLFSPVLVKEQIAGYLVVTVNKKKFRFSNFERVFYLSDGGVITEGRSKYELRAGNRDEQLWIELDKATIYKESGIIDYRDNLILFKKVKSVDYSDSAYLIYFISPTETFLYYLPQVIITFICLLIVATYIYYEFYKRSRKLEDRANIDELSRLYNRAYFNKVKHKLVNADYYIGILDIDHFKSVNDNYGHDVGDDVIRKVAASLKENIRDRDYAFRVGGEEFVIILKSDSYEHAEFGFERLRANIANIGTEPPVTASLGFTRLTYSPDKSFKVADQQLYKAKNEGRDQIKGARS